MDDRAGPGFRGHGNRGRVGRGDVRPLLLAALLSGSAHGYELMRRLEGTSGGRWRPSPGSVYPRLQVLEEEGLVCSSEHHGRKVYQLTAAGRRQADAGILGDLAQGGGPGEPGDALREAVSQLHAAAKQVAAVGGPGEVEQAAEIVRAARRALYRLLAGE
jgi:DNA-binding PadR family transcriptional regulator